MDIIQSNQNDFSSMFEGTTSIMSPIDEAAKAGDLALLISLHEQGHEWTKDTSAFAAADGHFLCLQFLHKNGCSWDHWVTANAARAGHLDCLQYLHENGCEWDRWSTSWAAEYGQLECLRYLHEHGCQWDHWATRQAAAHGHQECLQYLVENGCEVTQQAVYEAAQRCHLECLGYLLTNGCEWTHCGHFDCLRYFFENKNGCPFKIKDTLCYLSKHLDKLDFDRHSWLREFLFPLIVSEDMPEELKQKCESKIAQIALEKQAVETELVDKLSLDVVQHCLYLFI